ncbi:MAG: hypothetical protein ACRD1N_11170, partial [Terriglobia bacterium]
MMRKGLLNTKSVITAVLAAVSLAGVAALAQAPPPPSPPQAPFEGMRRDQFFFLGTHRNLGKVVTGAPYSAGSVTETVQELADGNRIDRKETGAIYRDAEGRTRVERMLRMIGPWAPAGKPIENIFISDPVAHVTYILNPRDKKAYKAYDVRSRPLRTPPEERRALAHEARGIVERRSASTQSLGTRMIEGLKAEGERRIVTIPAGQIGNEKPIKIVSESWYSPQLQVYVLTRLDDPRFGDTTYRLPNIKLG